MIDTPSDPFIDGRDARGRFTKGNPGGPGNPHARRVAALRDPPPPPRFARAMALALDRWFARHHGHRLRPWPQKC